MIKQFVERTSVRTAFLIRAIPSRAKGAASGFSLVLLSQIFEGNKYQKGDSHYVSIQA
jgi:hypothetical protein